jgi:serine/threonine protein kinase/WD40 repeat protein
LPGVGARPANAAPVDAAYLATAVPAAAAHLATAVPADAARRAPPADATQLGAAPAATMASEISPDPATMATAMPAPAPRRDVGLDQTLAAGMAGAPTLSAELVGGAGTLPGPYTVADLPSLPRIDDNTYAIGTEIARGGMGKILAARDRRLRREVVIKVMVRESGRIDPRFEREALITARLQHPSIVRVYDAGVLGDGRAFYAMERVRGRSLEVVLDEATTLRERLALLPHAIAVSDALAYAHNEGVVHRDLKPSNVLLGPYGETVLIDWGLAKDLNVIEPDAAAPAEEVRRAHDSSLTQIGAVMGTPAFMAPEQARGEPADERTDIYALGALLYTMLTGAPPHSGQSSEEVIDAVIGGRRRPILDVEPGVPVELATIVEHAMKHAPQERYASAKELADDLRAFAAGKLVASHEYSTWHLVRRWVKRYRVALSVAAVALVLLALTGVLAVRNVYDERDIALDAQRKEATARLAAETAKDRFVLKQATAAFDLDPSRAAAWLKRLSDAALSWPETGALAAKLPAAGLSVELAGHHQDVELVVAPADGVHAATASDDATVRWWDINRRGAVELPGHTGPIESMTLSSDGVYLATAGTDHQVLLWTLATGASRRLLGHSNTVRGVAFSPDNTKLASTSEDGSLYLWDVASASGGLLLQYGYSLRPLSWIDNTTLLVGAFDGAVARVEVTTKRAQWLKSVHKAEMRCIAITPDRKYWIMGDEDGRVSLWNSSSGKVIRELAPHTDVARRAIITADGRFAVTGGGDSDVHVYSLPDGAYRALTGNTAGVKDIDVQGHLVASAGIDGIVRVWNVDGTLVHAFRGHRSAVKGVAFAGNHLVTGAEDKMVRVWPLVAPPPPPTGPALRSWLDEHTNVEIGD